MAKTIKQCAKDDWSTISSSPSAEELSAGALMRIADTLDTINRNLISLYSVQATSAKCLKRLDKRFGIKLKLK